MGCGSSREGELVAEASGPMRTKAGLLGVIRLDYSYPPALGDIDHPGSFAYEVVYRVVPGRTQFRRAKIRKSTRPSRVLLKVH